MTLPMTVNGMFMKPKIRLLVRILMIKVNNKQDLDTELAKTKNVVVLVLRYMVLLIACDLFLSLTQKVAPLEV